MDGPFPFCVDPICPSNAVTSWVLSPSAPRISACFSPETILPCSAEQKPGSVVTFLLSRKPTFTGRDKSVEYNKDGTRTWTAKSIRRSISLDPHGSLRSPPQINSTHDISTCIDTPDSVDALFPKTLHSPDDPLALLRGDLVPNLDSPEPVFGLGRLQTLSQC